MLLHSNFSKLSARTSFPSLHHGFHLHANAISPNGHVSKTLVTNSILKPRTLFRNSRVLYSTSSRDVSAHAGKSLPWISAYDKQERAQKPKNSAWEKSAEKFFVRNGEDSTNRIQLEPKDENLEVKQRRFKRLDEYESMDEPTDNKPNWYKKKETYKPPMRKYTPNSRGSPDSRYSPNSRGSSDSRYSPNSRFEKFEVKQWKNQENWGKKTWKEATESTVPKLIGQGIYGLAPVLSALTASRREFYTLYIQETMDLSANNKKKKDKKGFVKVLQLAENLGLKTIKISKHDLNMVTENRPHQGLVLDASALETVQIKELEKVNLKEGEKAPIWIALDEVTDPQNLGAIIRSAYFFGITGIILCAKNSAPLSGVVSKASAGSLELIEIFSCKNMMQFLSSSADNGFRVLGGSVSEKAEPISEIKGSEPTILVLGSEGMGLRTLVERSCTQLVRIEGGIGVNINNGFGEDDNGVGEDDNGSGLDEEGSENETRLGLNEVSSFLAVESLNVSVAAGVLMYHLVSSNRN